MTDLNHWLALLNVPPLLGQFLLTVVLSFTIGLELHSYRKKNQQDLGFGTTRTFTLLGVLGFILFVLDDSPWLYALGLLALMLFLTVFYTYRVKTQMPSILAMLLALLTYILPAVVLSYPTWFSILYVVILLLLMGEKSSIRRFSDAFHSDEMVTFSKYLIMIGVVLPLLPAREIFAPYITVTFYQVWLALLVVSSVSYLSYLMQTYVFREKGLLFAGILGGLYSSTATTVVLARRSQESGADPRMTIAIIIATVMMYLRLLLLIFFLGHVEEAERLMMPFMVMVLLSLIVVGLIRKFGQLHHLVLGDTPIRHPLEFRTAVIFALMFVLFAALTKLMLQDFGQSGLTVMSLLVGLVDTDPFILSLLAGKFSLATDAITGAILIATASNNMLKAVYAFVMGRNRACTHAALWLMATALMTFSYAAVVFLQ
jgi:uncharacterized membrane protein (DUF4010 family)